MRSLPLALTALLATASITPAAADTLIDNANGLQVTANGQLQRFTGVLIGNDGRVIRLYAKGEVRPKNVAYRLDAKGRAMLPGLIDAHGHVIGLGLAALDLDLTGTRSLAELQNRLRAYAAATTTPRWIRGRGWNQELWADKRFPTTADLDAAVSDRPVWLERVDGHAAVGNSLALREAGITAKTKAPAGGRIENGMFVDAARELVEKHIPPTQPKQLDRALLKAQEIMLSQGLTAAADMGTTAEDWNTMRRLGDSGRLQVRVLSYALGVDNLVSIAGPAPTQWLYDGKLKMGGVKLYADGALGSRGAYLKAPYSDMPSTRGLPLLDDAKLKNLASRAAMDGFQVAVHAIGDAANAQVIGAIEELAATYKGDRRWRIEHAQVLDPADIPRLAKTGIIASMQPTHQTSDRTMAEARLGEARLAGAYAWQTIVRSGARMALGSDFPVESPNPFPGLSAAISRQGLDGQPPGGWRPQDRLTLEQALAGFTRDAAYAGFAEDRIGSLDPGHYADFIFVDRDIETASAAEVARMQVLETWVAGKRVYQRPASAPATPAHER
ncbi:amidohydrolase [Sphingomonas rhizophila]|uniref:Amidohydrolase n=1 Tax=Sphingomonas rhizophila TaxID=2071607 RepID=A0A7G9S979_9SPHN|nr:amidohydrolase [Sphingomonas rhizophila]QNN64404.1 amidohydrolase [Sphingomonas rhizophila]